MPLIETKGAASAQGFGLTLGGAQPVYIEDVFSTWLYTGNGSTQTITNGIDLSGKGGLVWIKRRNAADSNCLQDSARGFEYSMYSDAVSNSGLTNYISSVNSSGFSLSSANTRVNGNTSTYVSWTFRKQPKFFDIVTWTGNGTVGRTIAHNLGSTPGCIIVKATNNTTKWVVWHRSGTQSNRYGAFLNDTGTYTDTLTQLWGATGGTPAMTSTSFSVGDAAATNDYYNTYVAYVFAHDAGGFGLSGTDNVISCGGTALNASGFATVSLGYEPQFVMIKSAQFDGDWAIYDTMRGAVALKSSDLFSAFSAQKLMANSSAAESTATDYTIAPSSTGFTLSATGYAGAAYDDFIYIAIRRGPMKVPTSGTSVYNPIARTGTGANLTTAVGFPVDLVIPDSRSTYGMGARFTDRLRGGSQYLTASSTAAEDPTAYIKLDVQTGVNYYLAGQDANVSTVPYVDWNFRRAPGFFDEVCYTGTGGGANAYQDVAHNLGVTPELIIVKQRDAVNATAPYDWPVYQKDITSNGVGVAWMVGNAAKTSDYLWRRGASGQKIDASTFSLNGNYLMSNQSGGTYVAYLFATCPGVSKVGSYTGTGALQTVNCGFTGGARFVLIKRTDSTGDWYVYDSARGISSGNDPYLLLNSTAAEVTGTNYVDTTSVGFQVTAAAPAGLNANGGTYIFLAIA